jgi:aminopeptidase N
MRFGIASPDDLREALETESGQDLDAAWETLIGSTGTDLDLPTPMASPAA